MNVSTLPLIEFPSPPPITDRAEFSWISLSTPPNIDEFVDPELTVLPKGIVGMIVLLAVVDVNGPSNSLKSIGGTLPPSFQVKSNSVPFNVPPLTNVSCDVAALIIDWTSLYFIVPSELSLESIWVNELSLSMRLTFKLGT